MSKECECPYHYDDFGCMGEGCGNEGTINVPGIGYICAEGYDHIDRALADSEEVKD
jgi:hypothetical protein